MAVFQSTTPTPSEGGEINRLLIGFTDLPFVHRHPWDGKSCGSNWHVPPASNYGEACKVGQEWAKAFIDYLEADTTGSNALGNIAASIDFTDASANRGYWVGFFSTLQTAMCAMHIAE
jgi:hypothetical protein